MPENELGEVKGKIMELKELLKPEQKDVQAIKKKMEEVNALAQKMSTEMYQKAGQQYQQEHPSGEKQGHEHHHGHNHGSESSDDNVVDADYEVKDDKKKKK